MNLNGKNAVVTAAGQGIGNACARALAAQGASVLAVDINPETLETLADVEGVETHQADLLDASAIEQLANKAEAVNVLVNCAGFVAAGSILECDERDWQFSFDLNVTSMFRMTKAMLPKMLALGGGSIVNISSVASSIKGVPNRFAYTSSKAAVNGLTKSVAADFVRQNIRCNAICPGTVDSPSLHDRLRATGDYEQALKDFIARQPLGRIGTPEEIAAMAVYLASDDSAFVTGQTLAIDGGWSV